MEATHRRRVVTHEEWTLSSPVHISEIYKAIRVAEKLRSDLIAGDRLPDDITISSYDDEIVIGFSYEGREAP